MHTVDLPELVRAVLRYGERLDDFEFCMFVCRFGGATNIATSEQELVRYLRAHVYAHVDPIEFGNDSLRLPDSFHIALNDGIYLLATRFFDGARLFKLDLVVEADINEPEIGLLNVGSYYCEHEEVAA